MDREERRLRRRKDTRDAVVVLTVFAMIVALVVAGAVFGISKLMSGRNHTPVNGNAGADTQATETQETESIPQTEEPEATETQTVVDPTCGAGGTDCFGNDFRGKGCTDVFYYAGGTDRLWTGNCGWRCNKRSIPEVSGRRTDL